VPIIGVIMLLLGAIIYIWLNKALIINSEAENKKMFI
jgi:hypothetical protein